VATVHGRDYENDSGLKRRFRVALDKIAYWLSAETIVVSPSMRDAMVRDGIGSETTLTVFGKGSCGGIDPQRYAREAVNSDEVSALRRHFNLSAADKVLLSVGRLRRDKGINELVYAFLSIEQDYPDWHLVVIGHEETVQPLDVAVREALQKHPRIHCKEWIADPRIAYAMSDVFVFPTWREGFGNVAMEAASMELPVVVAASIGSVDTAIDGVTGLLFPTRDVAALAGKLRQMIEYPELRKRMGQAGRRRVIEEFDSRSIIQEHWALYRRLGSN
jgi:glycosyltransferase involved in cell wall biosynthesis